jgi:hypothetical protein
MDGPRRSHDLGPAQLASFEDYAGFQRSPATAAGSVCPNSARSGLGSVRTSISPPDREALPNFTSRFWMPVDTSKDRFTVAVGIDNEEAARQALSDQLTDWTYA